MDIDELRKWLLKHIDKVEKQIDRGGPFHALGAQKEILEEVLEKIDRE